MIHIPTWKLLQATTLGESVAPYPLVSPREAGKRRGVGWVTGAQTSAVTWPGRDPHWGFQIYSSSHSQGFECPARVASNRLGRSGADCYAVRVSLHKQKSSPSRMMGSLQGWCSKEVSQIWAMCGDRMSNMSFYRSLPLSVAVLSVASVPTVSCIRKQMILLLTGPEGQ